MVDQPSINHGFPIGVGINGFVKNLCRVQCWGSREPNLNRIKVIQHPPIFRDVVIKVAELQL